MPEESKSKFDAFIAKVVGDPAKPQETLMLKGFLGASSEANHTRIYTDPTLEDYVDVANSDIVHTEPLPKEQSPLGGYHIWIKKSAEAISGKAGADRKKARFLEGPIAQAAAGAAAPAPAPVPALTVPLLACHPTLVVQFCKTHFPPICPPLTPFPWQCGFTHAPVLCPPSLPLHHCPPTPPPLVCHTPLCPTLPVVCPPPLTVNQPICAASGGGPACPIDTPITPQTPQIGGGGAGFAGAAAAPAGAQFPQTVLWTCQSVVVWQCGPVHSALAPCPSVPVWHCPSNPIICQHTAFFTCQTVFQPQCLPVVTNACPVVTAGCPFGPGPVGPFGFGGMAAGAGAAAAPQLPISQTTPCGTIAPTACGCQTALPQLCPTPLCPSVQGFHCPTLHQYHCPSVVQYHCPSVLLYHCPTIHQYHCPSVAGFHCQTPACPTAVCTDIGPHCNPTPNPIHCPTPNEMCPPPTVGFQCPSIVEICPTSSPLFCAMGPAGGGPAAGAPAAAQAAAAPQQFQATMFCQATFHPYCNITFRPWCPPHTLSGLHCTPFCPI